MQTSGDLVTVFAELSAGVKNCKNNLQGAPLLLLVHSGWDASTIVLYGYGIICIYKYLYICTITSKSLIYGVIYNFIHKMVQTSLSNISYVHGRTFAYGLQPL